MAFLLRTGPTALKFLSRISTNNSSAEFNMYFLGSDDMSCRPPSRDFGLSGTSIASGNYDENINYDAKKKLGI